MGQIKNIKLHIVTDIKWANKMREDMSKVYVGGLQNNVTDPDLYDAFEKYGAVESVTIIKDRESGDSRGFGFVQFDSENSADKAISATVVIVTTEVEGETDMILLPHETDTMAEVETVIIVVVVEIATEDLPHVHDTIVHPLPVAHHPVALHLVALHLVNVMTVLLHLVAMPVVRIDSMTVHLLDTVAVVPEDTREVVLLRVALQGNVLHTAVVGTTETAMRQGTLEVMA